MSESADNRRDDVVQEGAWGWIRYAVDASDHMPAREFTATTKAAYDEESEELLVTAHCGVVGQTSDDESAVSIEATFELVYELPRSDEMTQSHFEAFAEINGLFNLWPFWRELVQNITMRMGLPPLTLPVRRRITLPTRTKNATE